jgi:regulation of enolase protein 1 (concanavalin A-like superfamily)
MEWLNEPASWQRTGDVLTVSVDPGTDFWRETGYGYIRDSGHVYGEVLAGDLDISVRLRCKLSAQYDQVGVMLRADERTWLKTGVEFFEGRPRLSTVLTLGRSSWMVTDLPEGTDDIVLRVSRRGDAVEVRYVIEDGPPELAALVFLPPGREVLAGVMAAAPEGPGFRVTFHDLRITERDWSGPGADGPAAWPEDQDQDGWDGEQPPEWQPAGGEPGWPVPGAEEGGPE